MAVERDHLLIALEPMPAALLSWLCSPGRSSRQSGGFFWGWRGIISVAITHLPLVLGARSKAQLATTLLKFLLDGRRQIHDLVEAIGDLHGGRSPLPASLGADAGTIPADDLHLWMPFEPLSEASRRSIRQ